MEHRRERESETVCDDFEFAESQIAVVQLPVANAFLDQLIHERFDFLRRWFLQTSGGALNCVGQTDNGAFLRLRFRSAVAKTFFLHFWDIVLAQLHDFAAGARVFVLLKRALVKVTDEGCAVMLLNNVDDALVKPVLKREIHAFLHMRDDDQRDRKSTRLNSSHPSISYAVFCLKK